MPDEIANPAPDPSSSAVAVEPAAGPSPSTAAAPAAPATDAGSPPASGAKPTLLSHVFEAVKANELPKDDFAFGPGAKQDGEGGDEQSPGSQAKPKGQDGATGADPAAQDEDPLPDEVSPEELQVLEKSGKIKAKRRIEQLLNERRDLRGRLEGIGFVEDAMKQHRLQKDDVEVVLGLATLLQQGRFEDFLSGVQPYIELAAQYTGRLLPDDLATEVKAGRLSQQRAAELASLRMQGKFREQITERDTQDREVERRRAHGNTLRTSVNTWEAGIKSRDPDYARKAPLIRQVVRGMIAERGGVPPTEAEAVAMAKAAYDQVSGMVPASRPQPRATAPMPNGSGVPSTAKREPKTLMEAVIGALH